jgi:hypothetical protein
MHRTGTLLLVIVAQLLALAAFAQTDEFGRAAGGSIDAITKAPKQFSGSLGLTHSSRGQGYDGSLGGELLEDRIWFFAAASVLPNIQFSTPDLAAFDAKATAQPVDWTSVTASFSRLQQPVLGTTAFTPIDGSVPSSFLSLRSTSVLSDRMTLSLSFTKSDVK